ncbi:lamin tail domain-containing protein [Candidatus Parcubacteria bacterium]|nr:lamin tail domain-containing protein [Candidatus Parcubacteria bacterium]
MKIFFDIIPPKKLKKRTIFLDYFINKGLKKIICLLMIISLNWTGLLAVGQTLSYFNDTETASGSSFSAGTLDFFLHSGQNNFVPKSKAENLKPEDNKVNRDIQLKQNPPSGGLPFQYTVEFEKIEGNDALCSALWLKAVLEGTEVYNDSLAAFSASPVTYSAGVDNWHFKIWLPDSTPDELQGKVCKFNFVFKGWQDNVVNCGGGCFDDIEEIESTIKAGYWNPSIVLNEFLPNADNYPEFIEIYNKTASPIELAGFYVKADGNIILINSSTTALYSGGSTIIPANGWLVVTTGGDLINDSSGTITLYNQNNIEADSYTYGAPEHNVNNNPGWTNNLAGYWPFDDDVEDKSGNANHGTNNGAVFSTGKINQVLSFNGVDDYVEVADSVTLDITDQITMEAWIKVEDLPDTYSTVVSKGNTHPGSYMIHLDERTLNTYRVCPLFYIGGSYGNWQVGCSNDLNYGEWVHVVVTYDGLIEKTFINGLFHGQESRGGNIDSTSDSLEIAHDSRYSVGVRHLDGVVDEIKIYNRALNTSEILEHYNDVTLSGTVPPDKSYARIPDGIDHWVDPIPTPGAPNLLDLNEKIFVQNEEQEEVSVQVVEETSIPEETPNEIINDEISDDTIFDDAIEDEDTIIDVPDIDPIDTVTPSQDGVNIVDEEEAIEFDSGEVLNEEAVEEIPADEPIDEPTDADEEIPVETDEEIVDKTIVEEATEDITEEKVIEETVEEIIEEEVPAIEEQPIVVPEDNPSEQNNNDSEEENNDE